MNTRQFKTYIPSTTGLYITEKTMYFYVEILKGPFASGWKGEAGYETIHEAKDQSKYYMKIYGKDRVRIRQR